MAAQLANSMVTPAMINGEVHPKLSDIGAERGQYPHSFEKPRPVQWFLALDGASPIPLFPSFICSNFFKGSTLDCICATYGLATGYNNPCTPPAWPLLW